MIKENKMKKYAFYALGEVILLVVGILIALQINNWNNERISRAEELKTYTSIKKQIESDSRELKQMKDFNGLNNSRCIMANDIISNNRTSGIDTLAYLSMLLSEYSDFQGNGNTYEMLARSGDIKLIKNEEILKQLKKLDNTYNYVNRLEDIHWELIMSELPSALNGAINYSSFEIIKPEQLYSTELQNMFFTVMHHTNRKDTVYLRALQEIDGITSLIDLELDPDTQ